MRDRTLELAIKGERQAEIAVRGGKVWVEIECTLEFFYASLVRRLAMAT